MNMAGGGMGRVEQMNVLFLSSVFTEKALQGHDVASHAASEWVKGFCGGLAQAGFHVETLGHIPARVWPLGNALHPYDPQQLDGGYKQSLVRYWNLWWIRRLSLGRAYQKLGERIVYGESQEAMHLQTGGEETRRKEWIVCSYNALAWQVAAGSHFSAKGCRWIMFVLDDDDVSTRGWTRYVRETCSAWGHVFVSQWAYDHAPVRRKLLLEGGFSEWKGDADERSGTPSVFYAGSLADYAGMAELRDMISAFDRPDVEFWICGKGRDSRLESLARHDGRVKLLGFLSAAELDFRLRRAWVVVNPRKMSHMGARMNFPSKLLRYLSYGKPVVSMWTEGVPREYEKVCAFVKTAKEMARDIRIVLDWDDRRRAQYRDEVYRFLVPHKTWSAQGARFAMFVQQPETFGTGSAMREHDK